MKIMIYESESNYEMLSLITWSNIRTVLKTVHGGKENTDWNFLIDSPVLNRTFSIRLLCEYS